MDVFSEVLQWKRNHKTIFGEFFTRALVESVIRIMNFLCFFRSDKPTETAISSEISC